ncbi:hypothetical protein D1007_15721 [Hordeum vulgare]|nr:hypothetical protein D1007_15721 [Hordeum vulgare]
MPCEQHGGCGFFEWHDDPLPKFLSDQIGHLRDEVHRLRGGWNDCRFEDVTPFVVVPESQIGRKVLAISVQDQMKEKNAEIDALKRKYHNVVIVFVVFVVGLVVEKMLLQEICTDIATPSLTFSSHPALPFTLLLSLLAPDLVPLVVDALGFADAPDERGAANELGADLFLGGLNLLVLGEFADARDAAVEPGATVAGGA